MFSFTNNSGDEMCLRPDLTIPTCKHFLENIKKFENGQLCYSGPVFRSSLTSTEQSLELNQSGIEIIYKDSSKISNFEKEFAEKYVVRYCIGLANGTDALYVSQKVLGIGNGDEVITVTNSFYFL